MNIVVLRLEEISKNCEELFLHSVKYNSSDDIKRSYYELNEMFKHWSSALKKQNSLTYINIREHFKFSKNVFKSMKELINSADNCKQAYYKSKRNLISKKEDLFRKGDITKWDIGPNKNINTQDKTVALPNMLVNETNSVINLKQIYGYYLNSVNNEFERLEKIFAFGHQQNLIENSVWAFALNSFLYNSLLVNRLYTKTNEQSYSFDEDIVESFSSMELPVKRNFVIFHLMGQHVEFKERYPHTKEFLFFTKDSINRHESWMTDEKRQMIADYDNATRYNDYVMSKIFNLFRDKKSIVVYFSDHGEEVYDYRDSYGRKDDGMSHNQIKYLHEVPFVIWCSDSYCREQPETIKRLRAALHRPFMIDNICQLLFHLGGVKTKYYYSDRDLISTEFKPRKRIIVDKYDYDKVMQDEIKTKR